MGLIENISNSADFLKNGVDFFEKVNAFFQKINAFFWRGQDGSSIHTFACVEL